MPALDVEKNIRTNLVLVVNSLEHVSHGKETTLIGGLEPTSKYLHVTWQVRRTIPKWVNCRNT